MYIQKNAGGDVSDIIKFLMETVNEEYAIGVKDGKIVKQRVSRCLWIFFCSIKNVKTLYRR